MVRDEIQKWHQQEMNEFLKMEKSQFKVLEEESKMEFEFPTDNTWLAKEPNRPTERSTMFNPEEWQDNTEWESHLIGQATRPTLDDPERSALGKVLKKLVDYNNRPYDILDEDKVEELIDEKSK